MEAVHHFIDKLGPVWQREVCYAILDSMLAVEPKFEASIKWKNPYFSLDGRASIKWYVAKEWINVYFYRGAQFDDPDHLFVESDNRDMKMLKIFPDSSFNQNAFQDLVRQSL